MSYISTAAPPLPPSVIISNHAVNIVAQCYTHCMKEEKCFGFNYRAKERNENAVNCQLSNSTETWNRTETGEWVHYQDVRVSKVSQFNKFITNINVATTLIKSQILSNFSFNQTIPQNISLIYETMYLTQVSKTRIGVW